MKLESKDYYYHGIPDDINMLISIIENGILSRNKLAELEGFYSKPYVGFNGYDYVSICKKTGEDNIYDCFHGYVKNHTCIVLKDDIEAIETKFITTIFSDVSYKYYLDSNHRYSDLVGEYQVKDMIEQSHFVAIGIPLESYFYNHNYDDVCENLSKLLKTLEEQNLDIPIIDTTTFEILDVQSILATNVNAKSKIKRKINM